jgi:hypothetical protein
MAVLPGSALRLTLGPAMPNGMMLEILANQSVKNRQTAGFH